MSAASRSAPDAAPRPLPPEAGVLLEAATRAASAAEFRAEAAEWLARRVGAEAVLFARLPGADREAAGRVGLSAAWMARLEEGLARYGSDFQQIAAASVRRGGFLRDRDTDMEDWAGRAGRAGFEEDLVLPLGIHRGTGAVLLVRGAPVGTVLLGRERASGPFTEAELDALDAILPVLALGEAVHAAPAGAPAADAHRAPPGPARRPRLTRREQDVLEYLVLGLQNREIGLALGTSVNTIRKQVAGLFGKLEVASRAELVSIALREGLVPHAAG